MSPGIELALALCAKATIILAIAAAIQAAAGSRLSAASRHLLWVLSVAALLALPAMVPLLPGWSLPAAIGPLRERAPAAAPASDGAPTVAAAASDPALAPPAAPVGTMEPAGVGAVGDSSRSLLPRGLLLVYLLGATAVLSRLAVERVTVRRLEREGRPNADPAWGALLDELSAGMRVPRRVRLLRSAERVGPLTWGTLSPTILIPDSADAWSDDRRRAVLLHELAHVERWDVLTQTLAALATAVYWFHPGVWWAARRLRIERELACDDRVLAAGARPHDYAGHLLEIARASRHAPLSTAALSLAHSSRLEGRMRAILDRARNRAAPRRRTVVAAAVGASVLLVALAGARAARPQGTPVLVQEMSMGGTDLALAGARASRPQGTPVLVEELRIGGTDADHRFENVDYMAVGDDGAIFVADQPRMARVRMYDRNGRFVRDIGGPGEGPGQYQYINGLVITPAGELAMYDVFNSRISIFDARGNFLRSMPSRVGGNWIGNDFHVDEEGNFYVFGVRSTTEIPVNPVGALPVIDPPPRNNRYYLKLSPRGEIMDTVDLPSSTVPRRPGFVVMTPEAYLQPFPNELVFDFGRDGRFVFGHTSGYAFDIQTGPGEVRRIQREYTPIPIEGAERAQWEARADHYTRMGPRVASAGVTIPAFKPAYRDLDIAEDGRIWVHRYAVATERPITMPRPADAPPALTLRDVPTFDVFERDGRFFATVVLPENTRMTVRKGDRLWGTHVGPTGETSIVRYRME